MQDVWVFNLVRLGQFFLRNHLVCLDERRSTMMCYPDIHRVKTVRSCRPHNCFQCCHIVYTLSLIIICVPMCLYRVPMSRGLFYHNLLTPRLKPLYNARTTPLSKPANIVQHLRSLYNIGGKPLILKSLPPK